MNFSFPRFFFTLDVALLFSACSGSPSEQTEIAPTPNPNTIYSSSPDNKYSVELELSETPVKFTVLDNTSQQRTQIPISYRYYNKIVGNSSIGFKWSADNKIVMFVLYREPFSDKREEDFSSFFAIDVEQLKPITVNYSSLPRGLWYQNESGIATLEHGGLNDIDDFYFSGTNCYKGSLKSECENSYVSPSGNWELSPWEENADVTLTSLSGNVWQYSYPVRANKFDYLLTFVQGWTDNEKYVLFSPALGYSTSSVYGLFQMDLSNGNVISLLGNDTIDQPYYVSVSPHGTRIVYITSDRKAFMKDLSRDTETSFNISLAAEEMIANFIWSPDETMVVFAKLRFDKNNEIISTDYLRLDTTNGELITFLKNEPEYLNIMKLTNSEVSFGRDTYSLADGALLK